MFPGRSKTSFFLRSLQFFQRLQEKHHFSNHRHNSDIGQHFLENLPCASQYSDTKFSILARGHTSFHLSALQANFIKSFQPNLCRYREFLLQFKIHSKRSFTFISNWLPLLTNQTHSRFLFFSIPDCWLPFSINQTHSPFLYKHDRIALS